MKNGLIFCTIKNNIKLYHLIPSTNLKTHWWKGALPILIANAIIIIISVFFILNNINDTKIKMDLVAWIKKYLIEASDLYFLFLLSIRGIKASRFISKPTQTKNQELLDNTHRILKIRSKLNIIKEG